VAFPYDLLRVVTAAGDSIYGLATGQPSTNDRFRTRSAHLRDELYGIGIGDADGVAFRAPAVGHAESGKPAKMLANGTPAATTMMAANPAKLPSHRGRHLTH
jgi:hypothetical protein